jgi:hypothetical protein
VSIFNFSSPAFAFQLDTFPSLADHIVFLDPSYDVQSAVITGARIIHTQGDSLGSVMHVLQLALWPSISPALTGLSVHPLGILRGGALYSVHALPTYL